MNRFFKTLIISTFVALGLAVIVGLIAIYQLPTLKAISSILSPIKKPAPSTEFNSKMVSTRLSTETAGVGAQSAVEDLVTDFDNDEPKATGLVNDRLLQDMMSPDKPLSDFCKSLTVGKVGAFSPANFTLAFSESFESTRPDPRIQATKPLLRYVFRLPKMQQLFETLQQADVKNDENLLDKAQFYTTAVAAYAEMREHQKDMESILDRSYLFMGLNNLIAKKPELANDPRVQTFCQNTEMLFNQGAVVDFENEKNNFLNLLNESSLTAQDISFNPEYRSNLAFNFDGKSLTFSGGWLDELIQAEPVPSP